jgi:hypothetical protein
MTDGIETKPIDIIRFVGIEHEQFLISLANNPDDNNVINHIQGLYNAATADMTVDENEFVVFQLLTFTHYHFLFATSCIMRCHLSEAFASVHVAIDAALIAAQIIHDRASQVAYAKREKPFNKLMRHYKNLIRHKKPLPHPLLEVLIKLHDAFSTFASHADIASFVHRVKSTETDGRKVMAVEYFQFARNKDEKRIHTLTLFHTFIMILDVFSDFLVQEQNAVPVELQNELRGLGAILERRLTELQAKVAAAEPNGTSA